MAASSTPRRLALIVSVALVAGACGSDVATDEPLGDQLDGGERQEFIDGFVEGAQGAVARSEAECISNTMFDAGLSLDEILASSTDPTGPGAVVLGGALDNCIDPTLDVSVPLEGEVRAQVESGIVDSGVPAEQAACLLDVFVDAGIDARDLFLAGIGPNPDVDAVTEQALASCG